MEDVHLHLGMFDVVPDGDPLVGPVRAARAAEDILGGMFAHHVAVKHGSGSGPEGAFRAAKDLQVRFPVAYFQDFRPSRRTAETFLHGCLIKNGAFNVVGAQKCVKMALITILLSIGGRTSVLTIPLGSPLPVPPLTSSFLTS